jgi:methyltransferase
VNFLWMFLLLLVQRLAELLLAARNRKLALARGGIEYHPETYRYFILLHVLFLVSLLVESYPWRLPLDPLTWFCLVMFGLLQLLRYWCIQSLGERWNTRIIVTPGVPVSRRGPYRWFRHPNYLVVTLELAIIPLLARAPLTLLVFSLANLALLRQRIKLEEEALKTHTDDSNTFADE